MATLTRCLTDALVRMHPKAAGKVGEHVGPVLARAVICVLARGRFGGLSGAHTSGRAAVRSKVARGVARSGGSGALAALVAAMLPARPARAGSGGGVFLAPMPAHAVEQAHGGGHGMAAPAVMARSGPRAQQGPPENAGQARSVLTVFLQKQGPDRTVSDGFAHEHKQTRPTAAMPGHAAAQPAGPAPAPNGWGHTPIAHGIGTNMAGPFLAGPPRHVALGKNAGCMPPGSSPPSGVVVPRPRGAGLHVLAMLLGRAGGVRGHRGVGQRVASMLHSYSVHAPPSLPPMAHHGGLMAGVLHQSAGLGGAPRVAPPRPGVPDYLQATSRAVGFASTVPPLHAPHTPTVQAQITVNATGGTPQAIGDEIEHRIDTLRMQARQANMGQF